MDRSILIWMKEEDEQESESIYSCCLLSCPFIFGHLIIRMINQSIHLQALNDGWWLRQVSLEILGGVVCSDISWEATDLLSGGLDQTCFHGYGLNTAACIGNWNRKGRIASSVC